MTETPSLLLWQNHACPVCPLQAVSPWGGWTGLETTAEKASLCVAVGETAHSKDVARDWAESELPRGDLG